MATADVQIPKTHKAAVYDEPGKISIAVTDVETPEPGPGEVLINLFVFPLHLRRTEQWRMTMEDVV